MYKKTFISLFLALVMISGAPGPGLFLQSVQAASQATITVNTITANNETIHMMVTISSSDNHIIKTGHAPLTFTGDLGKSYTISVEDSKNYDNRAVHDNINATVFNRWQDNNSTDTTRTITLEQDLQFTAIYNRGHVVTINDLGVLQLVAHDIYNHLDANHPPTYRGDNLEDEILNLSTLLDHGQDNVTVGGEFRNSENIMLFTTAVKLGHEYLTLLNQGKTPQEARELTVHTYLDEVRQSYQDAFGERFPPPVFGASLSGFPNDADGDLNLRTAHSFVPGHVSVNGTLYSILDPSLVNKTLDDQSLNLLSKPLDGTFDPALLNIVEEVAPGLNIDVSLLDRDITFGQQFDADISFASLLNEIRDGYYHHDDTAFKLVKVEMESDQTAIFLGKSHAAPGTQVGISGMTFYPGRTVTIQADDNTHAPHLDTLTTSGTITTETNGNFTNVSFTVPSVPPGIYTIYASDGTNSGSAQLHITGHHDDHDHD